MALRLMRYGAPTVAAIALAAVSGAWAQKQTPFQGVERAAASSDQIQFSGTPQQLGAELARRNRISAYPIYGYDQAELEAGAARLKSMSTDEFTLLWSGIGERHFDLGRAAEKAGDTKTAQREFNAAYDWYTLARWPGPTTPRRQAAYDRSLEAWRAWDRYNESPAETLRIPTPDGEITALLRMPKGHNGPVPLYIEIGGIDGYKELLARAPSQIVTHDGVATLVLDSPGTGQSVKTSPRAWEDLRIVIESVMARPDIDPKRVALWGGSFGAYWANVLAYKMGDHFVGVVSHGPTFDISQLPKNLSTGEYLFDGPAAFKLAVGTKTVEEAIAATKPMSLLPMIDQPTPPMLLLNGAKDTIIPIDDLTLFMIHGSPKDAWVNPTGIHLGREAGVWDSLRMNREVTLPWVYRKLKVTPAASDK